MHKKFLLYIAKNLILYSFILFLIGILIPPTPKAKGSSLFSKIKKDKLLDYQTNKRRLILVGGSNICFGLDSKQIEKKLNLFPINTSIGAGLGLDFMMNDILRKINKNDLVLLIPEYHHFFDDFAFGACNDGEELTRMMIDVDKKTLIQIDKYQIKYLLYYFPYLSLSKLNPNEYFTQKKRNETETFNFYGDKTSHWYNKPEKFKPENKFNLKNFNINIINKLLLFEKSIKKKKAKMLISFPCYQDSSFNNSVEEINYIYKLLLKLNFNVISNPAKYKMNHELMFNSPYHLIKKGVDIRTQNIINDIKDHI